MNAIPADFNKDVALKFECKLRDRKSVATFVPEGYDPEQRVTVQLSRPLEPEEVRWWNLLGRLRNHRGKRSQLVYPVSMKIDTARAVHATLDAALKAVDARSGASNIERLPMLPIRIQAEPCKLTFRQKMRNKLIGW